MKKKLAEYLKKTRLQNNKIDKSLYLRAEIASRMPGLDKAIRMEKDFIELLAGYPQPSDRLGRLKWFADADAASRLLFADALISAIKKDQ